MTEKAKLNRCPFCGSVTPELVKDYIDGGPFGDIQEFYAVECSACNCIGPTCDSQEKAVEFWNKGMMRIEVDRIGH